MTDTAFPTVRTPAGPIPATAPWWNRQRASQMPFQRYASIYDRVEVSLTQRTWPTARITAAPLWVPVDLRDGNQALAEPMDPARKRRFFELLVAMGYKEIEVGYPSASRTDSDFVRLLAESDIADVTIVVFTPARRDLIERTVESIRGITNDVVVHMYTATAPTWRDVVLGKGRDELRELVLAGGRDILDLTADLANVRFEFSPEVFNLTEPDYVLELCDAMTTLWDAAPDRPVILNLPATVEVATPNVYADQIEYMHRNLARRDSVILSVHPHNDRGTGVACAELALLAGAQRVEGCVFGNGERTGNVDIATLALNLLAQGVDPMIDFSDIDEIARTVSYCTRMPIHERHPYVGDLVHTAFSGTHQDAIKKGLAEHRERAAVLRRKESETDWRVPYLPIDPADIGRTYDAVIRVNSQSGKGGIAYLLQTGYGLDLPRRMQIDFARHVQAHTDDSGEEVTAAELFELFEAVYSHTDGSVGLKDWHVGNTGDAQDIELTLIVDGATHTFRSAGANPVDALTEALEDLGRRIEVLSLAQQSLGNTAVAYLEYRTAQRSGWAFGRGDSVIDAALTAVCGAVSAP
ncbi:2-isopropylmalate synthase [Mycolicibacterium goodii]|uniref:2-isopropylmalate synthase n=2 Tax=Mycolicibacterium goodii TaxID=134601 RepID=A0ABS6HIU2_MYCGD|nr:2-isopropylmalate synthase [Mycolicibacterium goodii]MBU8822266.1 2-isopropylmalate synthase [Mycolicibacterium goodii]MBU8834777.1 2-isopropylmalate synthase [Mycolicibacterium goodii]